MNILVSIFIALLNILLCILFTGMLIGIYKGLGRLSPKIRFQGYLARLFLNAVTPTESGLGEGGEDSKYSYNQKTMEEN